MDSRRAYGGYGNVMVERSTHSEFDVFLSDTPRHLTLDAATDLRDALSEVIDAVAAAKRTPGDSVKPGDFVRLRKVYSTIPEGALGRVDSITSGGVLRVQVAGRPEGDTCGDRAWAFSRCDVLEVVK